MAVRYSPEIESLTRRIVQALYERDSPTIANLFSDSASFTGIGSDADEWWYGGEGFKRVMANQLEEVPPFLSLEIHRVDAFEDGAVGWAAANTTLRISSGDVNLRISAVFSLEHGMWRTLHWHSSVPVPNEELLGVELTTTLDDLLESMGDDASVIENLAGSQGTMTLVFTDIVDSTALGQEIGDRRWADLIGRHESVIRSITEPNGGLVVKMLGDGSMLGFGSARSAIEASLQMQEALAHEPYLVRIGVHAGDVIHSGGDFLGATVTKAARVAASAAGGEIKVSSTVCDLVGALDGVRFGDPVSLTFKGLAGTHQLMSVSRTA